MPSSSLDIATLRSLLQDERIPGNGKLIKLDMCRSSIDREPSAPLAVLGEVINKVNEGQITGDKTCEFLVHEKTRFPINKKKPTPQITFKCSKRPCPLHLVFKLVEVYVGHYRYDLDETSSVTIKLDHAGIVRVKEKDVPVFKSCTESEVSKDSDWITAPPEPQVAAPAPK